jgi:xylulokinase
MGKLLLGLDIGSSSSKAVLVHRDGTLVANAERPHQLSLPRPGWAEHDAEETWWADVRALLAELGAERLADTAAVAVSGIGPCLLPLDASGAPLRPAILYGIDTRAAAEIEELTERYGAREILESGGSPLTSQAIGPKLLWLRRHEPDVWERTARFAMASSYAVLRLTGEYVLDHHSASQCNPLYDLGAGAWRNDRAQEIAPSLELPGLLWPGQRAGLVTVEAASATGLPAGTPVAAGTIDAWADTVGVGMLAPGDTTLIYGTTMFIVQIAPDARPDPSLWLTEGVEPRTHTIAAGMATSGALTAWFREIAGTASYEELLADAAAVPAGADGLVALPYFAGERTPLFDPNARGALLGLTLRHGRGHLYRALLEATAFGVRHNLEAIESAGGTTRRLAAVGGGTRGSLWTQIVSDVTGRAQEVPELTIGAAYGAAALAAACLDEGPLPTGWNRVAETVEPETARREVYDELYEIYRGLYTATRSHAHRLAALQLAGSMVPEAGTNAREVTEQANGGGKEEGTQTSTTHMERVTRKR